MICELLILIEVRDFLNYPLNYNGRNFSNQYYAQNRPVKGGYFAGYYNGKQNIVGRRLFVEV